MQGCASWWHIQSIITWTTSRELFIFHLARGTANCGKTDERAEPDEQTPFATHSTRRMFIWHKPAVGLLLCNKHTWRQDTWKREYFNRKTKEFCLFFFFCDVYIPRNYFLSILSWKIAVLVLISEFPAFFLIVWAVISPDFAGQIGVWTDRSLQGRSRKCCCRWLRKCFASSFFKAELSALCLWKRVWSFFIPHNEVFVNLMPSCGLEYLGTPKIYGTFTRSSCCSFCFGHGPAWTIPLCPTPLAAQFSEALSGPGQITGQAVRCSRCYYWVGCWAMVVQS